MSIVKENNYVCSYCGLAGYKKPSRLNKSGNHFCNKLCYGKYQDKRVEVECDYEGCENKFLKKKCETLKTKNNFCSEVCGNKFRDTKVKVECFVCKKKFLKELGKSIKKTRHCCNQDCAKLLRKYHKDWGAKRSKLEIAIEEHFKIVFPFMYIRYNKTDIGYELDICVPCLELAIELNGPHHYKAIFGEEKLLKTQETDRKKVVKCKELGIKLFVINVSEDRDNKKVMAQRISQVEQIVRDRIIELSYVFSDMQMVMDM
jgi:hypothetical protein